MSATRFTKDHEWVRQEGDVAVIGITDYAQEQLGDVVYVELPDIGRAVEQGKPGLFLHLPELDRDGLRRQAQRIGGIDDFTVKIGRAHV